MPDAPKEPVVPGQTDFTSLEERKFRLELRKFEFEKSKSKRFGFFNSNFGIVITAIVGIATVLVSSLQVQISQETGERQRDLQDRISKDQLSLQKEVSRDQLRLQREISEAQQKLAQEKDERTFQFDIARLMLEKQSEISTQEIKRVYYLREVVMTLPNSVGKMIARRAADNASDDRVRSTWLDGYVKLAFNDTPPAVNRTQPQISVAYVSTRYPVLATDEGATRIRDILNAAADANVQELVPVVLAYALFTSNFFAGIEEDFRFPSAEQIAAAFPNTFSNPADARPFVGKPSLLANKVYGGRFGNDELDDGWKFRGRGYLGTTGKAAYARSTTLTNTNLVADPGRLTESKIAAKEIVAAFNQLKRLGQPITVVSVTQQFTGRLLGLAGIQKTYETLMPGPPRVTDGLSTTAVGKLCTPWC
jgi:predicted chitinase